MTPKWSEVQCLQPLDIDDEIYISNGNSILDYLFNFLENIKSNDHLNAFEFKNNS